MALMKIIFPLFSIFISVMILDYIWLGIITKNFIIKQFGSLIKVNNGGIQFNLVAGVIAWFIIALGCFIFAVYPSDTLTKTLILGAAFGFISYAIYDLTNLSFITNYPLKFVFVDIAWGTFLCTIISAIGYYIKSSI
jgi:uncharacterized membrane protein